MKNPMARPLKEGTHKVAVFQKRVVIVSQIRLAHIQQLESDISILQRELSKERAGARKAILNGAAVESGPIRAFIRKSHGYKKLVIQ